MDPCAHCGQPGKLEVRDGGRPYAICLRCADREFPGIRLGSLHAAMRKPRFPGKECPNCKTTREEIERTGLASCPLCYEAFEPSFWAQFGLVKREFV